MSTFEKRNGYDAGGAGRVAITTAERHIFIFKHESIIRINLDSLHFLRTNKRTNE